MQAEVRRLRDENSDLRREVDRLKREGERDRDEVHRLLGGLDNTRDMLRDVEAQVGLLVHTCVCAPNELNMYIRSAYYCAYSLSFVPSPHTYTHSLTPHTNTHILTHTHMRKHTHTHPHTHTPHRGTISVVM